MSPEMIDLGRRAVACKGWKWLPGMRVVRPDGRYPMRAVVIGADGPSVDSWAHEGLSILMRLSAATGIQPDDIPDLCDAATLGCLLALVREVWGNADLCVTMDTTDGHWHVGRWEDEGMALIGRWGKTEAEALVAALEAA